MTKTQHRARLFASWAQDLGYAVIWVLVIGVVVWGLWHQAKLIAWLTGWSVQIGVGS